MKEFKGTKGKWILKDTVFCSVNGVEKIGVFPENKSGFMDKSICSINGNNENGLKEFKANAKLIAAAPEMLEMLRILTDVYSAENIEKAKELLTKILD